MRFFERAYQDACAWEYPSRWTPLVKFPQQVGRTLSVKGASQLIFFQVLNRDASHGFSSSAPLLQLPAELWVKIIEDNALVELDFACLALTCKYAALNIPKQLYSVCDAGFLEATEDWLDTQIYSGKYVHQWHEEWGYQRLEKELLTRLSRDVHMQGSQTMLLFLSSPANLKDRLG